MEMKDRIRELEKMLDEYSDNFLFRVIKTKLGVKITPIVNKILTKEDIIKIASSGKTIILSGNEYISQIDIYSEKQSLFKIKRKGIVETILFN